MTLNKPNNRLLQLLPLDDLETIEPMLERVAVRRGQVLEEARLAVRHAHFIESGIVSVQARTKDAGPLGVGLIGTTGMTGVPLILETWRSPLRSVVQAPGESLRITAADFAACLAELAGFRKLMLAYVQVVLVQSAHIALCNSRHSVGQRLRRWLLLAQAMTGENEIRVTHKLVASLLGVRRPSVTVRLSELERLGGVVQRRAEIKIVDRKSLETGACDCHRMIATEFERLRRL